MERIYTDIIWISWNVMLAFIAIVAGQGWIRIGFPLVKLPLFFIWLVFLPNTIYLMTDLVHVWDFWNQVPPQLHPLYVGMYATVVVLGIGTFILAIYPFEKILQKMKCIEGQRVVSLLLLFFLIAFGMTLGRVERTNSWDIITNPGRVIHDTMLVLFSAQQLMLMGYYFAITLLTYIIFRKVILELCRRHVMKE